MLCNSHIRCLVVFSFLFRFLKWLARLGSFNMWTAKHLMHGSLTEFALTHSKLLSWYRPKPEKNIVKLSMLKKKKILISEFGPIVLLILKVSSYKLEMSKIRKLAVSPLKGISFHTWHAAKVIFPVFSKSLTVS